MISRTEEPGFSPENTFTVPGEKPNQALSHCTKRGTERYNQAGLRIMPYDSFNKKKTFHIFLMAPCIYIVQS